MTSLYLLAWSKQSEILKLWIWKLHSWNEENMNFRCRKSTLFIFIDHLVLWSMLFVNFVFFMIAERAHVTLKEILKLENTFRKKMKDIHKSQCLWLSKMTREYLVNKTWYPGTTKSFRSFETGMALLIFQIIDKRLILILSWHKHRAFSWWIYIFLSSLIFERIRLRNDLLV